MPSSPKVLPEHLAMTPLAEGGVLWGASPASCAGARGPMRPGVRLNSEHKRHANREGLCAVWGSKSSDEAGVDTGWCVSLCSWAAPWSAGAN